MSRTLTDDEMREAAYLMAARYPPPREGAYQQLPGGYLRTSDGVIHNPGTRLTMTIMQTRRPTWREVWAAIVALLMRRDVTVAVTTTLWAEPVTRD